MEQYGQEDQHGTGVAEIADLVGQVLQFDLQGAVAVDFLQLLRQLPVDGGVAHLFRPHQALAFHHDGAAVEAVGIQEIRFRAPGEIRRSRLFFRFFAFAVQGGLVQLHRTGQQHAIDGHFVARFELHGVARHDIVDGQFHRLAVTPDLARDAARLFLQLAEGVLVAVLGPRRNEGRQQDGNKNADRFQDIRLAHVDEHDVHQQGHEQDADDRVVEIAQELAEERFPWRRGQGVIAVRLQGTPGFFRR